MAVGNEMKIFIKLTKYNTRQKGGESNPLLISGALINQHITPSHSSVQRIYEEWDIPINAHRYGISKFNCV